jgi:DNA polymerase III alpha subunit
MIGDIDIDTATSFDPTKVFPWIRASMVKDGQLLKHPCGVYPQRIARDPITGLAAVPYDVAEDLGFIKLDFLHLTVYDNLNSREELETLVNKEPEWTLLQLPSTHKKLFQLAKHGELLMKLKPTSLEELADVLALIRPGKSTLVPLYTKSKTTARQLLWAQDSENGYTFKKAHAYGYALVIVLQLHLIDMGRI